MRIVESRIESPIGTLRIAIHDGRLCGLSFPDRRDPLAAFLTRRFGEATFAPGDGGAIARALKAYFDGELKALEGIPVDAGGSAFQQRVWTELQRIPVGETLSYRQLAGRIERPSAVRAVATANATNPVAVVIPCHRVIHADGSISGYGGGVERKRWLLRHESAARPFALQA